MLVLVLGQVLGLGLVLQLALQHGETNRVVESAKQCTAVGAAAQGKRGSCGVCTNLEYASVVGELASRPSRIAKD